MKLAVALLLAAGPAFGAGASSPEPHADGTVTFRLAAPKAVEVLLAGEWMKGKRELLKKGGDGVWSATVGPLVPDLYTYSFIVDGVGVADPRNPLVKLGVGGPVSLVEVSGPAPAFHAVRPVPHGTVHVEQYTSRSLGQPRRLHVYTPPGYGSNPRTRYPVLYLLHGVGDTDGEWSTIGRAASIADNLLADGKTRPMIIVMPNGHAVDPTLPRDQALREENTARFGRDLLEDVIPLVERSYRVLPGREQRAIAGLSMGGGQALNLGLSHLDRFSHLGVFSAGPNPEDLQRRHGALIGDPKGLNARLRLFFIACGTADNAFRGAKATAELLAQREIRHVFHESEGGHVWANWRRYLHEMLPLLFRPPTQGR